jgi:large subunit ribosomal protein L4e
MAVNIYGIDGSVKGSMELPEVFSAPLRPEVIRRAVISEESYELQPQAHSVLAGMQTSARYYGRVHSYRSGRHMGRAIRPREKLGGGAQGKVRRIPSSTKGRRAHPHMVEKILIERINRKEYQMALASAIAATAYGKSTSVPLVVSNAIEAVKKTKDIMQVFDKLKLSAQIAQSHDPKLGGRRYSVRRHFRSALLLVMGKECDALKAARNIPGVDACTVSSITVGKLAPGGNPGRQTLWSEDAAKSIEKSMEKIYPHK